LRYALRTFLASAVGVYPILEKAACSDSGVGELIDLSVTESSKWQRGGKHPFRGIYPALYRLLWREAGARNYLPERAGSKDRKRNNGG